MAVSVGKRKIYANTVSSSNSSTFSSIDVIYCLFFLYCFLMENDQNKIVILQFSLITVCAVLVDTEAVSV